MVLSAPAGAGDSEMSLEKKKAVARQLFLEGDAAREKGDYVQAEDKCGRGVKLYPAVTLLVCLARAQVQLGKFVEAQENYYRAIGEKLGEDPHKALVTAQEAARREVVGLEDKIAWVVIKVTGSKDFEVTVDGTALDAAMVGVKYPVNPGTHRVLAKAKCYRDATDQFTVQAKQQSDVSLTLTKVDNYEKCIKPNGNGNGGNGGKEGLGTQQILGIVSLGIGGAALLVGGITGILAIDKHGELEDRCPNSKCPPDQEDGLSKYRTMGTVSTVGFIATGVFAVTGTILLLTAPSDDEHSDDQPKTSFGIGPGYFEATIRF